MMKIKVAALSLIHHFTNRKVKKVLFFFLFNSHSVRWSPYWVHLARWPLNGVLYLPQVTVMMMMENLEE
jgi:hypothetical protein